MSKYIELYPDLINTMASVDNEKTLDIFTDGNGILSMDFMLKQKIGNYSLSSFFACLPNTSTDYKKETALFLLNKNYANWKKIKNDLLADYDIMYNGGKEITETETDTGNIEHTGNSTQVNKLNAFNNSTAVDSESTDSTDTSNIKDNKTKTRKHIEKVKGVSQSYSSLINGDVQTYIKNNLFEIILKDIKKEMVLDVDTDTDYTQCTYSGGGSGGDITVDSALSDTSINPVENKVITREINKINSGINETNTAVQGNTTAISQEVTRAKENENNLDTRIEENTTAINSESTRAIQRENEIEAKIGGGSTVTVDDTMSETSVNPVQNKVVTTAIKGNTTAISQEVTRATERENAIEETTTTAISQEVTRATERENAIDEKTTANNTAITQEVDRAKKIEKSIEEKITANNEAITQETARATQRENEIEKKIKTVTVDSSLSDTSVNPVQNKVVSKSIKDNTTAITQEIDRAKNEEKRIEDLIGGSGGGFDFGTGDRVVTVKEQTQYNNVDSRVNLKKLLEKLKMQVSTEMWARITIFQNTDTSQICSYIVKYLPSVYISGMGWNGGDSKIYPLLINKDVKLDNISMHGDINITHPTSNNPWTYTYMIEFLRYGYNK